MTTKTDLMIENENYQSMKRQYVQMSEDLTRMRRAEEMKYDDLRMQAHRFVQSMAGDNQASELRKILNILDDGEEESNSLINQQKQEIEFAQEELDKKHRQEEERLQLLMKEKGKRNV